MSRKRSLEEVIGPYFNRFKAIEGYFVRDNRALEFFETHPKNTDPSDVLLKIVEVGEKDVIKSGTAIMKHILSLDIDQRLATRDPQVVNEISKFHKDKNDHGFYTFASKYCNMHDCKYYPVFHELYLDVLPPYFERERGKQIEVSWLLDYESFKQIMTEFTSCLDLPIFDYRELDKFIWLYGEEVTGLYRKEIGVL